MKNDVKTGTLKIDNLDGDEPPVRYERASPRHTWETLEDILIRYAMLPQPNAVRLADLCEWMCGVLGRKPNSKESDAHYRRVCGTIMYNRTVTRHIDDAYKENLLPAIIELHKTRFDGCRAGADFSWAEVHKFFPQYDDKTEHGREPVVFARFVQLLGRGANEIPKVRAAWDLYKSDGPDALATAQPDFDVRTPELAYILVEFTRYGVSVPSYTWTRFHTLVRGGK